MGNHANKNEDIVRATEDCISEAVQEQKDNNFSLEVFNAILKEKLLSMIANFGSVQRELNEEEKSLTSKEIRQRFRDHEEECRADSI